jgi:hypothetical protein
VRRHHPAGAQHDITEHSGEERAMVSEVAAAARNRWLFVVPGSVCLVAGGPAIARPGMGPAVFHTAAVA